MDFEIREMAIDDVENGLLETLGSLAEVSLTVDKARKLVEHRLSYQWRNVRSFVAVASGRVVGAITLLLEPKLIHGGGIVGHIEDVAVHSDFMNRGVGRQLIGHAISFCRKNSAYKVILNCNSELEAYYLQLGFHNHGAEMRLNLNE